jgi:hypothetical protein
MRPSEFNARFLTPVPGQDFDPPACDIGLVLLHRWAAHDPTFDRLLPEIPDNAEGKYAEAFYKHRNQCPKCNEERPSKIPDDPLSRIVVG